MYNSGRKSNYNFEGMTKLPNGLVKEYLFK